MITTRKHQQISQKWNTYQQVKKTTCQTYIKKQHVKHISQLEHVKNTSSIKKGKTSKQRRNTSKIQQT